MLRLRRRDHHAEGNKNSTRSVLYGRWQEPTDFLDVDLDCFHSSSAGTKEKIGLAEARKTLV